jgi:exosortase F-associated protein
MNKATRILLVGFLLAILIAIRGFVAPYFYDPFNNYFKNDYLYLAFPQLEYGKYFLHLFLRYFLNSVVSLAIIMLIFRNQNYTKFALYFFGIAFILLGFQLFCILKFELTKGYMFVFYLRRFLIQPLFLFILLPAMYYQKLRVKKLN